MALSSTYVGGVYTTGTVTVSGDKVTVVGVGTLWSTLLEAGDWILIAGQVGLVASVSDDTHLLLQTQWQGTLPSASAYVAIKMSWLRYDPALTQAKLRELLAQIAEQGNFIFTDVAPPDPALGQDGQWALKTDVSPWRLWYKTGGVWVEQKAPAGIAWRGAWSAATAYAPSDAVSYSGASYLAKLNNTNKPPAANPTEWDLMAAQGATGATGATGPIGLVWRGTWSAATAYIVNDGVALNGASYIAIAPNTNQSPPNATYWNVLAGASSAAIAPDSVTPPMLDAGTGAKQIAFRDRLNFVSRAGDTMTGDFIIQKATPNLSLVASAINQSALINFYSAGTNKWQVGKFTDDSFLIWDIAGARAAVIIASNGNLTFGNKSSIRQAGYTELDTGAGENLNVHGYLPRIRLRNGADTPPGSSFSFYLAAGWTGIGHDGLFIARAVADGAPTRLGVWTAAGLAVSTATASTASTNGALTVAGGVGIQGAVNIAGQLRPALLAMGPDAVYLVDIRIPSTGTYIGRFCNTHAAPGDNVLIVGGGPNSSDSATILFAFCDAAVNTIWGSIARNGTGISYNQTSDERGKPNRERLSLDFARGIVDALEIYDHDKEGNKLRGIGMLAQQAHAVHPSLAQPGQKPDAWWMAEKAAPMPFVIANLQQLNQRMDEMERRLAA